jgi:hypothetical protein
MPSRGRDVDSFLAELEQIGPDEVRSRIANGTYSLKVGEKGAIAKDWLLRKELARATEFDRPNDAFSSREQFHNPRRPKDAAWSGVIAAIVAVIIAASAAVIAYYSM